MILYVQLMYCICGMYCMHFNFSGLNIHGIRRLEAIRESLQLRKFDQALVQWQNMAIRVCKNAKIAKSQNPRNIHPCENYHAYSMIYAYNDK